MAEAAIEVRDLRKSYGAVEAVRGLSFSVGRGEVFGLLGPNGAGKTTTVEILEGQRHLTSGEVSVLGADPLTGGRALPGTPRPVPPRPRLHPRGRGRVAAAARAPFFPPPPAAPPNT